MRKEIAATATLRPFGVLKAMGSIGALPSNPRTMLVYDASLAWASVLLLAIGLVMVYSPRRRRTPATARGTSSSATGCSWPPGSPPP